MSTSTFTQARTQALNLEKQTESLLLQYSGFQNSHHSTQASEEETRLHNNITETLTKRDGIIAKLTRISETDSATISTSKLQQLTRHREILNDHKRSFHHIESIIQDDRNKNNLLFSVRNDIDAHKQSQSTQILAENANDYILDERVRVDGANSLADRLLQQAYQTRDELVQQRQYLSNAQLKMLGTIQAIPGVNVLISKINTRRKRDTLILATVISACIILLFFL